MLGSVSPVATLQISTHNLYFLQLRSSQQCFLPGLKVWMCSLCLKQCRWPFSKLRDHLQKHAGRSMRSPASPKKPSHRQCCKSPVSFNMTMPTTKAVPEKKACSSRQRSLNKTILHAGLLVAACHNIYTPRASAQWERRLVQKGYWTHQGAAFTSQRKSLSVFPDKVPVGNLLRITSSKFLSFHLFIY